MKSFSLERFRLCCADGRTSSPRSSVPIYLSKATVDFFLVAFLPHFAFFFFLIHQNFDAVTFLPECPSLPPRRSPLWNSSWDVHAGMCSQVNRRCVGAGQEASVLFLCPFHFSFLSAHIKRSARQQLFCPCLEPENEKKEKKKNLNSCLGFVLAGVSHEAPMCCARLCCVSKRLLDLSKSSTSSLQPFSDGKLSHNVQQ